ncbi:MAG TPA: carboxypeptidase regulatory-like domain-containing protein [Vicinamibacterales bacterium]|nr:carboxypeptidase regulatory-like domain-containing protein [Vicinamibacterales bacterium]
MRTSLWAFVLSLAMALPLGAQETRGNISGTVKDNTGVIPGATVRIVSTDTGVKHELTTNSSGYFEAPLMQPGNYEITVEMTGFKRHTQRGILLAVAQQMNIPIVLEVGAISETVTVTGEAPLLDVSSVSSAQTYDTRMVGSLPMLSNMPIMLTRFAGGVNPATNQSLVSQGFVDGTSSAAGKAFGGVGSNTYSIDGAANNSTDRRIAASPNSDMVEEMRVETSNFDSSIGHGTGMQISMTTKAGANAYRGTGSYQYWTNKFNNLNPSQKATFKPAGKALYDEGRSHNTAWTFGGPIQQNRMFFFANFSYVNDFIPGKNQTESTVPANEAHLRGDFSDLLLLPNPAQYQIYDPLTVRPDPAAPGRFIRTPFPNNIIPANRIVNPLYNLYKGMVPKPNQNFVEQRTTPLNNYYRGGEPDIPKSKLFAGRVDYNISDKDRIFIRGSKNTFIEHVGDWTYEVPEYEGLHSIDRSRPQWNMIGNWTRATGTMVIDAQIAANRFTQGDLLERLHEYKPSDMGLPTYLDAHCAAQQNCMLPSVDFTGDNNYQDISSSASSFDRARNLQGRVNLTKITSKHTLRGGVDVRQAQRQRSAGGNPSGQLTFSNDFTRQASDTSQLTPSNLGPTLAAFMLGIPTTSIATIQRDFSYSNQYLGAYGQDSWRVGENLTVNLGLRVEWENGIREADNAMVTDFDPDAKLAISDAAEAAYARSPLGQLPASQFRVRGGAVYASATGQDGRSWRPQTMFMPRVSAAYKLGEKTVVKGGYGMFYDTLNAADYSANNLGYNSTTTVTNSTNFGQTFGISLGDPFPLRSDGTRFLQPVEDRLGVNTSAGGALRTQNQNHEHTRLQRWRIGIQREIASNLAVEIAYDGMYADRREIRIRGDYLPEQYWIKGNTRDNAAQGALVANVANPYNIANFAALQTSNPELYQRMASNAFFTAATVPANRLLRPFSQFNTGDGLEFDNLPLGENKGRSIQILVNRRYANGFTANLALSFSRTRENRTVNQFDRAPTLWVDDNNSRPYRLSGGAVYELPFGASRRWMNEGGIFAALAGGWQLAGTFERQPGSLIDFGSNLFFNGDINNIKKDNPEIALDVNGKIDPNKYWFNVEGFERNPANTPTSFNTRAFPFQIDGLRGPGLTYVNLNIQRSFGIGGRRTLQARFDIQNLLNYAAFSNPNTDPTNTNFGKVVSAVQAAGAMRFFNFGLRFTF